MRQLQCKTVHLAKDVAWVMGGLVPSTAYGSRLQQPYPPCRAMDSQGLRERSRQADYTDCALA